MRYKKGLEEVGKAIINIGVASVVFAVIQPIVNDKFSPTLSVGAVFVFIVLATVGFYVVSLGGDCDDKDL